MLATIAILCGGLAAALLWAGVLRGELRRTDGRLAESEMLRDGLRQAHAQACDDLADALREIDELRQRLAHPRGPAKRGPCPACGVDVALTKAGTVHARYHRRCPATGWAS